MPWRAALARCGLEKISDQIRSGIGQIRAVRRNGFTPMRHRVPVALGAFGRRHEHLSNQLEPDDALCPQRGGWSLYTRIDNTRMKGLAVEPAAAMVCTCGDQPA